MPEPGPAGPQLSKQGTTHSLTHSFKLCFMSTYCAPSPGQDTRGLTGNQANRTLGDALQGTSQSSHPQPREEASPRRGL